MVFHQGALMRKIVLGVLALGLFVMGTSNRAGSDYGSDWCRRGQPFGPGIRVVEQVPYCGDCDNLIGPNFFRNSQMRYIGYLPWTRGCALGGCYGNFAEYGGCWRETRVPDGYDGWVVEKICN